MEWMIRVRLEGLHRIVVGDEYAVPEIAGTARRALMPAAAPCANAWHLAGKFVQDAEDFVRVCTLGDFPHKHVPNHLRSSWVIDGSRVKKAGSRPEIESSYCIDSGWDSYRIDVPIPLKCVGMTVRRMSLPRVRYLRTADDLQLAWAESGTGPLLIQSGSWLAHLEHDLVSPVWRHWINFFSER